MKIRKEGDDGWLYSDWESDEKEHLTAFDIQHIQMLLKNLGYKVSKRGIRHQWHGWKNMLGKSGYRGRNYRLFTPRLEPVLHTGDTANRQRPAVVLCLNTN